MGGDVTPRETPEARYARLMDKERRGLPLARAEVYELLRLKSERADKGKGRAA
jgi:hypothetical protein